MRSATGGRPWWLVITFAHAIVVLVFLVVWFSGLGFYSPAKGHVASGKEDTAKSREPRYLASFEITDELIRILGGRATVAELTRLYGLEDSTIRCSVERTQEENALDDSAARSMARRALSKGDSVTLCMD